MKKQILKTFFLLISTSLFLGSSVNITGAFLDSDLWLNLYKDLDEWLKDFEEKMYVYELSWQDKQDISNNINKILYNKWYWDCLITWINPQAIESIVNWNIQTVLSFIKPECYNEKTWEYSNKKIWNIINEIVQLKQYYLNKSKQKAKAIHEISRIWMYSDWNIDNSPFDIIKDLNDINAILFNDPIEYESEDLNFLSDYANKPLIWPLLWSKWINNSWDLNWELDWYTNWRNYNSDSWSKLDNSNDSWWEIITTNNDPSLDWNNYLCVSNNNDSWLDDSSLDWLIWSIDSWENWWITFNYWSGWYTPLPEWNSITPPNLLSTSFASQMINNWISSYKAIDDKNVWKCSQYFCIVTDFIVRNQRALSYSSSKSIQNIIETSNKHLKKAVNTSKVQSKMTKNNFEISLRDLNLPEMFHMWINISYKSPPILYLENLPWDTVKDMLREKYKNLWLNYDQPNNLNKFYKNLKEVKEIFLTTENSANRWVYISKNLNKILDLRAKMLNYNIEILSKDINNQILKDFEIQFKEISQFNINILDYIFNLDILIKKLKEIPIYTWS